MAGQRGRLKLADERAIQHNFIFLKREIDAKPLADKLYAKKVFNLNDKIEICSESTPEMRMDTLLCKILGSGPGDAYNIFLECLKENYSHVVKRLTDETEVKECETFSTRASWFEGLSDIIKKHVITDSDASRLAVGLSEIWNPLFLRLGLPYNTILLEQARYKNDHPLILITNLFIRWKQRVVREATVEALISKLIELEKDGLNVNWETLEDVLAKIENGKVTNYL